MYTLCQLQLAFLVAWAGAAWLCFDVWSPCCLQQDATRMWAAVCTPGCIHLTLYKA